MSEPYHLAELRIALDPRHPAYIRPPALGSRERVLDIGCGAGQTLIAAYPDRITYGLDVDLGALQLGGGLTQQVRFTCGCAEALPYAPASFDLVIARVSLPYTNLTASLREIRRVLAPGGRLWAALHPLGLAWRQARSARSAKGWVYFAYVAANGALWHATGRQLRVHRRCESFQTEGGMRRGLLRAGFGGIRFEHHGQHFVVAATAQQ